MAEKSPGAFRTISEVAEALDVPAHVLRFWESRFTQIKPVKRGGGRRYYRPSDVDLLRGIQKLLYSDGMTIKGAQKVLREKGVRHVMAEGKEADLAAAMQPPASADPEAPRDIADMAKDIFDQSSAVEEAPIFPETEAPDPETTALDPTVEETAELPEMADALFAQSFAEEAAAAGMMSDGAAEADISPEADMKGLNDDDTLEPESDEVDAAPSVAASAAANADEIRDIIGKLESLRDRMRAS